VEDPCLMDEGTICIVVTEKRRLRSVPNRAPLVRLPITGATGSLPRVEKQRDYNRMVV
jgi:hypothetical protein